MGEPAAKTSKRRAIIVSGSREWRHRASVEEAVRKHGALSEQLVVIHGACRTGADHFASMLLNSDGVPRSWTEIQMPAQWRRNGNRAGPMRNSAMMGVLLRLRACGYDVFVEAFGLKMSKGGTVDLVRKAASVSGVVVVVTEQSDPEGDPDKVMAYGYGNSRGRR